MTQQHTVGRVATTVFTDDRGRTQCVYHSTAVASFDDERIILNTGGYHTYTTKLRMNQFSNQFRLGYEVYQRDFDWFITFDGKTIPFDDRIVELSR